MKILVFGAGVYGRACQEHIERSRQDELVGFLDNAENKPVLTDCQGREIPVYRPEDGVKLPYDQIWVSNSNPSQVAQIKEQLKNLHIPPEKVKVLLEDPAKFMEIIAAYNQYDEQLDSRVRWLRDYAGYANGEGLAGSVAECGVWMGEFSYFINKYFPDRRLFLFDTFEGFSERDLEVERSLDNKSFLNSMFNAQEIFSAANERIVISRMLRPEQCVVRKGYFPDTAEGIEETFCFVNLDMDLYQPMLAGLQFFYDKMCPGGIILLHDYFHPELPGVKQAVLDFERELGTRLVKTPIGDFGSIAVIKHG